jgi:hypothetical protein
MCNLELSELQTPSCSIPHSPLDRLSVDLIPERSTDLKTCTLHLPCLFGDNTEAGSCSQLVGSDILEDVNDAAVGETLAAEIVEFLETNKRVECWSHRSQQRCRISPWVPSSPIS